MAKLTLQDVQSLQNESTVITQLKANNDATEAAMENTLSLDGTTPNQMKSNLDMNNYKVINLPDATTSQEPATYSQLTTGLTAVGNGAVIDAAYVTLDSNPALLSRRVLAGSADITITDGGAGNAVTLDVNPTNLRATLSVDQTDNTSDATKNAATATLTNKTIDTAGPNNILINGNALSATAGTATVTIPNSTDTLVGRNTTDTLTNKTLVAPALGTPASGVLTNATGLPVATGISGMAAGAATFLATPTSANLAALVTDETGTGANVFGTSPTLTTPHISSIVNTGTLTLPTSTDTLVGRATTDTLTNKTISGSSNTLSNIANGSLTNSSITVGSTGVSLGGTLSAPTGRGSSALNIDSATGHGDSNYTILSTDRHVFTNAAFTSAHTWTLPAASSVNAGQRLLIADLQGTVTSTNMLLISRAGSDTINGGTGITLSTASTSVELISDGVSKWYAVQSGTGGGGGGAIQRASFEFVATAGQTTFFGPDQNGNSLVYTPNNIDVFKNGMRLNKVDYTATNGANVVLAIGAGVSDLITIVDFGSSGVSSFHRYEYTATAGQTTFSGADVNGATLSYTAPYVLVMVNGGALATADYTATSGTSVVFTAGRALNDQVSIISLTQSSVGLIPLNNLSDVTNKNTASANIAVPPTVQSLTSGTSATYTTGVLNGQRATWIEVFMVGGGGGGAGSFNGVGAGTAGSDGTKSTFNGIDAAPGKGGGIELGNAGQSAPGGAGGTGGAGTATRRMPGHPGTSAGNTSGVGVCMPASAGGSSVLFGGGAAPVIDSGVHTVVGNAGAANTGGGGSGALDIRTTNNNLASAGGAGESVYLLITSPAASYTYTIGTGGAGGVSSTNGGAGGSGFIQVIEHYGS